MCLPFDASISANTRFPFAGTPGVAASSTSIRKTGVVKARDVEIGSYIDLQQTFTTRHTSQGKVDGWRATQIPAVQSCTVISSYIKRHTRRCTCSLPATIEAYSQTICERGFRHIMPSCLEKAQNKNVLHAFRSQQGVIRVLSDYQNEVSYIIDGAPYCILYGSLSHKRTRFLKV
jgi:hypothetical protein